MSERTRKWLNLAENCAPWIALGVFLTAVAESLIFR